MQKYEEKLTMKFNESKYPKYRQKRIAMVCANASSLRRQGPSGTIENARKFLARVHLEKFKGLEAEGFNARLNGLTRRLMRRFPKAARKNWGAARKVLNLFLRDALYDHCLFLKYDLRTIEPFLEVPLDGDVVKGLRKEYEGKKLPDKFKIKNLTSNTSEQFQAFAQEIAEKRYKVLRVHLDLLYYRNEKNSKK